MSIVEGISVDGKTIQEFAHHFLLYPSLGPSGDASPQHQVDAFVIWKA